MCVMCVIVGNKITSSSLDSFLKSLEMQSDGGLMRLCLEVCCVYLFIILRHSTETICNLNSSNSLIYNAYNSFKYWLDLKIRIIIWFFFWSLFQRNRFTPDCGIHMLIKELLALRDPLSWNGNWERRKIKVSESILNFTCHLTVTLFCTCQ